MAGSAFAILGGILLDVWRAAGLFSTSHWREVGRLADFPRDGTYPLPAERIAVVRKGGRLAAISLECTHLGCLVNALESGFFCPCHGSEPGRWFAGDRLWLILILAAILVSQAAFIVIGQYLRGENWKFVIPF
ncbi:hypothetical protein GSUB_05160 [Geoalkalibacter subterraneus]|uniref:Rieske domain-containing protein n=1 Tax=Geoalkalibacter subterraneus TaxID=483547 RepID=A0A0B5FFL8_9BACT|nr:hypothetical protein GSUB_05160 [Geoalkalibacter subterraneus]